jgi:mRNA interferase MazF
MYCFFNRLKLLFEFEKLILMQKNFDSWNKYKKRIQIERAHKHYHARDIWWCSLGVNVGSEHDGEGSEYQRPVLIIKGLSVNTCLAIPLTASLNKHP